MEQLELGKCLKPESQYLITELNLSTQRSGSTDVTQCNIASIDSIEFIQFELVRAHNYCVYCKRTQNLQA